MIEQNWRKSDLPTEYSVTLPVGEDQLREFITGLLGKPQTISRTLNGPFKVTREDVEDIYHLLDQRLKSQNAAVLASFVARISYDDDSSVLLNSFSEFANYREVKPLRSHSLHVSWTYLVQFQNKTQYEKQQIDLTISVGDSARQVRIDAELDNLRLLHATSRGLMNVRISHSDRSWGSDIDALMKGRLEHLRMEPKSARKWFSDYSTAIGFVSWATLFGMAIFAVYYAPSQIHYDYLERIRELEKAPATLENVSRSVALLARYIVGGGGGFLVWAIIFILLSLVGSIAAAVFISEKATYYPRSFLILTRSDEAQYQSESKVEWTVTGFVGSTLMSLVIGITSNIAFYYLTKWWVLK